MAKLAVWMVVRDDSFYVDMAIKSVLPYVDGIYILDNGSIDGTIDVIKSFKSDKIYLEQIKYNFPKANPDTCEPNSFYWDWDESRDGNSLEAETRNRCLTKCIEIFKPDWLIQIDADEVYTPLFFEQLKKYDLTKMVAIKHSTEQFLGRKLKSIWPGAIISANKKKYYDPHDRSWNPNLGIRWVKPGKGGSHVVPKLPNGEDLNGIWMDGVVHIHLHRTFGPKSEFFWRVKKLLGVPYNPRVNKERFKWTLEIAAFSDYDWKGLEFVINKWKNWGIW